MIYAPVSNKVMLSEVRQVPLMSSASITSRNPERDGRAWPDAGEGQIPSHSMAPASSSASSKSDFLARMTAVDPRQRRAGGGLPPT